MFSRKFERHTLTALTAVSVALALTVGIFGTGLGAQQYAEAAPLRITENSFGLRGRTLAPLVAPVGIETKLCADTTKRSDTFVTAVTRKHAPIPKPEPKPAPKPAPAAAPSVRSSAPSPSRSTAAASTSSGWNTAKASWYGPGFYGNSTASGEILTESSMIVAHRSLAFGTKIQFEYKGRSCTATVMDRGPHIAGRVFDLGPGTAKALGFSGVGTVSYRILGR